MDVFTQIKYLTEVKGMSLEEAIKEIEGCLHGSLPENIKEMIYEQVR